MDKYGLVVFSDYHAHLWAEFSQPTGDEFINTRFKEQVEALRTIFLDARTNKKAVVFAGDLFHKRSTVNTAVFNQVFKVFAEFMDVPTLLVRGNHDSMTNSLRTVHSLEPFKALANCTVVDEPAVVDFAGYKILGLPYGEEIVEMKQFIIDHKAEAEILVAHIGVEGAKESSGHSLEGSFSVGDLFPQDFKQVFLGHYHKRQSLAPNVQYIGNTVPTSFADIEPKGYLQYDHDGNNVVFQEIESKKFLTLDLGEVQNQGLSETELEEVLNNNYIRLKASSDNVTILQEMDTLPSTVRVEKLETFEAESRIGISVDNTPAEIVTSYLTEVHPDKQEHHDTVKSYIAKAMNGGE